MRVAVLSDLHIGPTRRHRAFRHAPARFCAWLDGLADTHDHVVLLGDTWQCDHGWGQSRAAQAHQLSAARARAPWLEQRRARPGWHTLHGNHDAIAKHQLGARTSLILSGAGARLLLTHGHQFDPVLGKAPGTSHAATWTTGRLRAAGLARPAAWLEAQDVAIKAQRFQGTDGPYARAAAALARINAAAVVVFGHTHQALVLEMADATYANSGTCSGRSLSAVSVDLAAGRVTLLPR